jgi:hypothetical protein
MRTFVACGAVLAPDARRVAMHVAGEGFLPVVDHLHRPVRLECEHRPVDLHGEVLASAEGTADAGEVNAHLGRREAEAGRDLVAVDVQPLCGDVDVHAALAVRDGQARFGPEEGLVLDAELVVAGDGHLAGRVRVSVADRQLADGLGRLLGVGDRLLRDVVDLDGCGGAAGLLGVLSGDEGDRLAEVAHLVHGQNWLVGELEAVALLAGDVAVREDGVNAGHTPGLEGRDSLDLCGRVRAADGVAVEHARGEEIAGVGELAGDLGHGVDAADGFADAAELEAARRRAHSWLAFVPLRAPWVRGAALR